MGALAFCEHKEVGALRTWSFHFVSSRYRDALFFSCVDDGLGHGTVRWCDGVI